MRKPRIRISDHAIVRFLARVGGVDIVALRAGMARAVDEAERLGARAVIIDGWRYVIRDDEHGPVLVTVEPRESDIPIRRSGRRQEEDEA